jgi:hypothetical protein
LQGILGGADQLLDVDAWVGWLAEFGEDELGGAFDELLGGADDQGRVFVLFGAEEVVVQEALEDPDGPADVAFVGPIHRVQVVVSRSR